MVASARPGLCEGCVHARVVVSGKGSRFYLCELSRTDPGFPRYPPLPVLACRGFRPREDARTEEGRPPRREEQRAAPAHEHHTLEDEEAK